jgi:HD-GYP domain-containing protein (c-di-GMP phosphodiesterase class II)
MDMIEPPFVELWKFTRALSMALGLRDSSTLHHSDRVQDLARQLGQRCGLDPEALAILEIAAAFHDIGKIGIRDAVLMKPAQLDEGEWELMRQHADMGARIIAATGLEGATEAAAVIRHHHERYDGSGYPDGLAGEDIPLLSRIISIVDAYDAMAVTRAYHHGRTHAAVLEVLQRETGRKFDPRLMALFRELVGNGAAGEGGAGVAGEPPANGEPSSALPPAEAAGRG